MPTGGAASGGTMKPVCDRHNPYQAASPLSPGKPDKGEAQEPVAWRAWAKPVPGKRWPSDQWVYWDEEEPTTIQDDPEFSQFQALFTSPQSASPSAQEAGWVMVPRGLVELCDDLTARIWVHDAAREGLKKYLAQIAAAPGSHDEP